MLKLNFKLMDLKNIYYPVKIFLDTKHSFHKGITVLTGGSNIGKTLFLKIARQCCLNKNKTIVFFFDFLNEKGDFEIRFKYQNHHNDLSSGEKTYGNFDYYMKVLENNINICCYKNDNFKNVVLLFDNLDLAWSPVHYEKMQDCFNEFIKVCNILKMETYILFASNSFHPCRLNRSYNIVDNEFHKPYFDNFEDWDKMIKNTVKEVAFLNFAKDLYS